jgi:AcrR family transcriptional regulator
MIVFVTMSGSGITLTDRKRRAMMLRVQDEAFRSAFDIGFAATTVEAIAAAADVSPSTVYRAFGTKEGIFLWDELKLPTRELFENELSHHSPVEASIAVVEAMGSLEFHLTDAEMRARFEFVLAEPALRLSLSEAFRHFEEELTRQFVRGGAVGPIEARITAAAAMAAMVAAFELWAKVEPPRPFSAAAFDAAASLRNVLSG